MKTVNKQASVKRVTKEEYLGQVLSSFFVMKFGQPFPDEYEVIITDIINTSYHFEKKVSQRDLVKIEKVLALEKEKPLFKRYTKSMNTSVMFETYEKVRSSILTTTPVFLEDIVRDALIINNEYASHYVAQSIKDLVFPLTQYADMSIYPVLERVIFLGLVYLQFQEIFFVLTNPKKQDISQYTQYIYQKVRDKALLGPFASEITESLLLARNSQKLLDYAHTLAIDGEIRTVQTKIGNQFKDILEELIEYFEDLSLTPARKEAKKTLEGLFDSFDLR